MRSRYIAVLAIAGLVAGGVALAANRSGYSGSVTYQLTNKGKSSGTGVEGVRGKGVFSGKLGAGARSLVRGYAAAAGISVRDAVKGGRYAVTWSMAKGTIHGTAYVNFKSSTAGSVCLKYTASPTKFDADFHPTPPKGTFTTLGGTGKGARTTLSGTFVVGDEHYHGEVDRTDTLTGRMASKSTAAHGLSATCRKLAKSLH